MPYRRTDTIIRKQAARQLAILEAARSIAAESGLAAVQIAPVAARAEIATGTVYRYFPSKMELVGALASASSHQEIAAVQKAAAGAPGPLSALAAAVVTFAARALRERNLTWALLAEPIDAELEPMRAGYRKALFAEFRTRIAAAMQGGYLPAQDADLAAAALFGALVDGLLGPHAPPAAGAAYGAASVRATVQTVTLFALRGLGVVDARARGLVVQITLPLADTAA